MQRVSHLELRFMGLNDLMTEIRQDPGSFTGDEQMETKVLNQVLALVEDKISEVKNQAVKWYAYQFGKKCSNNVSVWAN